MEPEREDFPAGPADLEFYTKTFEIGAEKAKVAWQGELDAIFLEEHVDLSASVDQSKIQDSCSVRNILLVRKLSLFFMNEQGELNLARFPAALLKIRQNLYSIGPGRSFDAKRQEHILSVLEKLHCDPELRSLLRAVGAPVQHRQAEMIIRDTLGLPADMKVTDGHARQAALSAWLCYLRQNVGSCFATAPAILVQKEQPKVFLKDIAELLATGRLKRTFGGVEYAVPMSANWGIGDLRRPFPLDLAVLDISFPFWLSPALIYALEQIALLPKDLPEMEKKKRVQKWCGKAVEALRAKGFSRGDLEGIFKQILFAEYELTEEDVREFENRPKGLVVEGFLMSSIKTDVKGKTKSERVNTFLSQYEVCKNRFNSFTDHPLLKSWEFTLASFAETKANFARWNLYSSLGLGPDEPGGIGEALYGYLKRRVEECNAIVHENQTEYELMYGQIKFLEGRMKRASSEQEAKSLQIEYQMKVHEFRSLEEQRDTNNRKAHQYANAFNVLVDLYDSLFPKYFQEVYDADIHSVAVGPYDDSPAGFRLLYKHGRDNTSLWTFVRGPQAFMEALASFFIAIEPEVLRDENLAGLEDEMSMITTAIVQHVKTEQFLESAFYRMAKAHGTRYVKDSLHNLEKIEKKPWVYTSGGSMETLVSCYWKRESSPTEVGRWVENELELLVFLTDTMKQIAKKVPDSLLQGGDKSFLMHSPTHAFLLQPGLQPFASAWTNEQFTHTWVRDNLVDPMKRFVDTLYLDEDKMRFLLEQIKQRLPKEMHHHFMQGFIYLTGQMRPYQFRDILVEQASSYAVEIDSFLYQALPLTRGHGLKDALLAIFEKLPPISFEERVKREALIQQAVDTMPGATYLTAEGLQDLAKGIICKSSKMVRFPINYHAEVSRVSSEQGLAMPVPILFADTNWVRDEFAFVVSPGSGKLELWRMDSTGRVGSPLPSWKEWVDGSRKDRTWGVFANPFEYTM